MGTKAPRRRRGDTSGAMQRQSPRRRRRPERTGPRGLGQAVLQLQGTGQPSELREGAQAVVVAQVGDARPHLLGARSRHEGEGIVEGPRVPKSVARQARTDGAVKKQPSHGGIVEGRAKTLQEAERLGRERAVGHPPLAVGAPRSQVGKTPSAAAAAEPAAPNTPPAAPRKMAKPVCADMERRVTADESVKR